MSRKSCFPRNHISKFRNRNFGAMQHHPPSCNSNVPQILVPSLFHLNKSEQEFRDRTTTINLSYFKCPANTVPSMLLFSKFRNMSFGTTQQVTYAISRVPWILFLPWPYFWSFGTWMWRGDTPTTIIWYFKCLATLGSSMVLILKTWCGGQHNND